MEGSYFSPDQGTFPKNWGTVLGKSRYGRVYPIVFHGRVKVGVDQSAVSVSRCK